MFSIGRICAHGFDGSADDPGHHDRTHYVHLEDKDRLHEALWLGCMLWDRTDDNRDLDIYESPFDYPVQLYAAMVSLRRLMYGLFLIIDTQLIVDNMRYLPDNLLCDLKKYQVDLPPVRWENI